MNITIFKDVTTEDALLAIEKDSQKYEGLYVEMDNKEERKFVKDSASLITGMLKKLDRARIDKTKEYKLNIESEARSIRERLEVANKPLIELIDEHKEKRAIQLAKEKAIQDAKDLAFQIEEDHIDALTLDKIRSFEIKEAIQIQKDRDDQIAKEASEKAEHEKELAIDRAQQAELSRIELEKSARAAAEQAKLDKIAAEKQAEIRAHQAAEQAKQSEIQRQVYEKTAQDEAKRKLEANKKHVGSVRGEIKDHLIKLCKVDDDLAVKIVKALLRTDRITINY